MRRARTDNNQVEIVRALRDVGASVQSLAAVGKGCPDLLVGYRGGNYLLEVKNRSGYAARKSEGKTAQQAEWHGAWRGGFQIVFTVDEALSAIGAAVRG